VIWPLRVYAYELMAEWLVRLKEALSKTLKGQITATKRYRYRLEGIGHAPNPELFGPYFVSRYSHLGFFFRSTILFLISLSNPLSVGR
jgi:hypothetical protein